MKPLSILCSTSVANPKSNILDAWTQILKINYWPIFSIARDIVEQLPAGEASQLLTNLRATVEDVAATGANLAHVAGSALCVALVTPPPSQRKTILFDAGQAAACMQLAAWELGVVSCLGTVWEPGKVHALLALPDDRRADLLVAFGYPLREDAEPRRGRKGGRRDLDDVVRWERW